PSAGDADLVAFNAGGSLIALVGNGPPKRVLGVPIWSVAIGSLHCVLRGADQQFVTVGLQFIVGPPPPPPQQQREHNDRLLVVTQSGWVRIWGCGRTPGDLDVSGCRHCGYRVVPTACLVPTDHNRLVQISGDGTVGVWDLERGGLVHSCGSLSGSD